MNKPKSKSPWHEWKPGWLQRDADRARAQRVIPNHAKPVR